MLLSKCAVCYGKKLTFIKQKEASELVSSVEMKTPLKIVSATFLLICFLCLKESICETRENVFYFTSKALFVLEIIKF